jgi:hypothetical protein
MRKLLGLGIVIMSAMVSVSAQTSSQSMRDRQHFVEDKNAALRVERVPTTAEDNSFRSTSYSYSVDDFKPGVVRVGPRTTYLKEGLRTDEVVRLLGKPISVSERNEKDIVVTTYEFQRGEGHILIAEFEHDLLVRSRTESRDQLVVQADRQLVNHKVSQDKKGKELRSLIPSPLLTGTAGVSPAMSATARTAAPAGQPSRHIPPLSTRNRHQKSTAPELLVFHYRYVMKRSSQSDNLALNFFANKSPTRYRRWY